MEDFTYRRSMTPPVQNANTAATGVAQAQKKDPPPEGWDAMVSHLQGGKAPNADTAWPQMLPHYEGQLQPVMAELKAKVCHDDNYKQLIASNGKLFVSDLHAAPEGMMTLHCMLKELPVKKIFLESDGMGLVLQNSQCMEWLRNNPHATPDETFAVMAKLCLQEPTARAGYFLGAKSVLLGPDIKDEEKADVYRRWIEAECAVARHAIDNDISVETMFRTDDPDPTKFYNRSMNEDAWRSFTDTSTGLGVFLVGENHIVQDDPNARSLYELLKKADGICARTPLSELRFRMEEERSKRQMFAPGGAAFYKSESTPVPQGPWNLSTRIPATSAQGNGTTELKHSVMFRLYTWPASVATAPDVRAQTPAHRQQPVPVQTSALSAEEMLKRFREGKPLY